MICNISNLDQMHSHCLQYLDLSLVCLVPFCLFGSDPIWLGLLCNLLLCLLRFKSWLLKFDCLHSNHYKRALLGP